MGNLLKNWDISRWIRLVSGVGVASYGVYVGDYFLLMLGALFAWLAVINKGCCCGGCSTSTETKAVYKDFVKPYQAKEETKK